MSRATTAGLGAAVALCTWLVIAAVIIAGLYLAPTVTAYVVFGGLVGYVVGSLLLTFAKGVWEGLR